MHMGHQQKYTHTHTHTHLWRLAHSKKLQSTQELDLSMIYNEDEISRKTLRNKISKLQKYPKDLQLWKESLVKVVIEVFKT